MKASIVLLALVSGLFLSLAACSNPQRAAPSTVDSGAGAAISGHYQPATGNQPPPPPPPYKP